MVASLFLGIKFKDKHEGKNRQGKAQETGHKKQDTSHQTQGTRRKTQDARRKTQDARRKTQDARRKTQDARRKTRKTQDNGQNTIGDDIAPIEKQKDTRRKGSSVPLTTSSIPSREVRML